MDAVRHDPGIEVIEHALVLDVLTTGAADGTGPGGGPGRACGVTLHVIGEGTRDGVGAGLARAVVLATGGIGQVFAASTNPREATGDGIAAALRARADVADLEFVQFHPTVLWLGQAARGQQPLISEAVRGEGALLLDVEGERFMPQVHELAELAPRDVVAKAIVRRMAATGADHVYLAARHLGARFLRRRFPTIVASVAAHGFDLAEDLVPVAPAQHYHSGGVLVDGRGRSSLAGLYAVGEVSCTGVHGANRLASNSLLEGLVFAHRIADDLATRLAAGELPPAEPAPRPGERRVLAATARPLVQRIATAGPGVIRSAATLADAGRRLASLASSSTSLADSRQAPRAAVPGRMSVGVAEWETTNLHQVATVLTQVAAVREESRGGHYREDFPERLESWRGRLIARVLPGGALSARFVPVVDKEEAGRCGLLTGRADE